MAKPKQKFVIIDGNAILHRAYHALPPLLSPDGILVNAVYGFATTLLKIFKEIDPQYIAVAFDRKGPTFRHKEYKEYKATREKKPDELYKQIDYIKELLQVMGVPYLEAEGFEADDIIATLAARASKKDILSLIVTGDMDTLQLVSPSVQVHSFKKGLSETQIYDEKAVKERYGLKPAELVDFKGLRGDPSDNLPGVKGIGEVGASDLIRKFGSIENLYKELEKDTPAAKKISPRLRSLLTEQKDAAIFGKKMVVLVKDVPLDFDFKDAERKAISNDSVLPVLQRFGFRSLVAKMSGSGEEKKKETKLPKKIAPPASSRLIEKESEAFKLLEKAKGGEIFLRTKKEGENLSIISFSFGSDIAVIANPSAAFLAGVSSVFRDSEARICGHDVKTDMHALGVTGSRCAIFDVMVAAYLTDPGGRAHDLPAVAFSALGRVLREESKQQSLLSDPREEAANMVQETESLRLLKEKFKTLLHERGQYKLFEEMEMPLLAILYEMERKGIMIDKKFLKAMSGKFQLRIEELQKKVFNLSGEEFNINSPAQLGKILFDKLSISSKSIKRTATGSAFSTAAAELEKLRGTHPIIDLISEYRELAKLKSTYIDALPELADKKSDRIHTTFNQAITATGRLSSSNPNLQNIPVKTELGREIRKAFIAKPGYTLIAADYSQFELRIAAHLSGDKKMIENFKSGEDIHSRTAEEIWNVAKNEVTPDMRRVAKAINFGIIYGMGPRKLAAGAGVSLAEAGEFIDRFFAIHNGLRQYLDDTKALAAAQGYVETVFGRRRYLPEITSGVPMLRAEAERQAINTPIQGSQADVIKIAMIKLDKILAGDGIDMLLQVHDELVFEVADSKLEKTAKIIRDVMENSVKLSVPTVVEVDIGKNWGEMRQWKG